MIGFTSFDRDIVIDGVTYYANTAIDPTAIKQDTDAGSNDFEAKGFIDSSLINDIDLRSGRYQDAEVDVFIGDFITGERVKTLAKGTWGETKKNNLTWQVTIQTNADKLNKGVVQKLQETCRWTKRLDDPRCGIGAFSRSILATINTINSTQNYTTNQSIPIPHIFNQSSGGGYIIPESGSNVGFKLDIDYVTTGGIVHLIKVPPYPFQVGDIIRIYPGCDGQDYTCTTYFNNRNNFGGIPTGGNFFPTKEDLRK